MSNADPTIAMPTPPVSSSTDAQPQETLLQRGAFDPPATPGTLGRLDRFEILRLLGEGGMGQVYLAREPRTDTRVAVKIMRPEVADDPQCVHRFLTEARHMYRLSHPRILRVLEVSDRPAGPYYVMPYVEGGSLRAQYRPGQPMPAERAVTVARQIAEALAHAHAHGLIHRDLKPDNVLVDKDGNAFLTDFGLVRTVFNDSMVDASASHLEGTAPYMSPAVARGEAEDTRCDIYAFGALLYELLTGQPPYTGRSPQMILDQVLKGPPTPLREVNPKASPALVRIAEGCLARELRDRYASMADVVSDLDRAAKGQASFGPHRRQNRLPRIAALLAGTLAVAALAGFAIHRSLSLAHLGGAGSPSPLFGTGGMNETPSSGVLAQSNPLAATDPSHFAFTTNNGAITITKYTGPGGDVAIPKEINELPVTIIGDRAFENCYALTTVAIPNSVTDIGFCAFNKCTGLTSLTIPARVTNIGGFAFAACLNLTCVNIPASVVSIGQNPFDACSRLTAIEVDENNPAYCSSEDGVLFNKNKTCIVCYPSGRTGSHYVIPNSVAKIAEWAFVVCRSLTSLTIPDSVTDIGGAAFRSCAKLTTITFGGSVSSIGNGAFSDCVNLTSIYFKGYAPRLDKDVFVDSAKATIYYRPGTKGWGATFGGRPTAVWRENDPIQAVSADGGLYMVVDLSAGVNATRYPITYLDAVPAGGWTDEYKTDKLVLRKIEPGTFNMGSPTNELGHNINESLHEVTLTQGFYIGVFEVTQRQWELLMGNRPSRFNNPKFYASRPVEQVSYHLIRGPSNGAVWPESGIVDAGSFIGTMRAKVGVPTIDLPTEAQWEYACRAGTGTALNNGKNLIALEVDPSTAEVGRYGFNGGSSGENNWNGDLSVGTAKVGSYLPNAWGLYDMHGNVWEWCLDWDGAYSGKTTDPKGALSGSGRALRGVSWNGPAKGSRSANRYNKGGSPSLWHNNFGFRIAITLPGTTGGVKTFGERPTKVWEDAPAAGAIDSSVSSPSSFIPQPSSLPETSIHDFACVTENGGVTIVKYTGEGGAVVIPAKVSGLPVTTIKNEAFLNCNNVTSVFIPANVTSIGHQAFGGCGWLVSILVDALNPVYSSSADGVLFDREKKALPGLAWDNPLVVVEYAA